MTDEPTSGDVLSCLQCGAVISSAEDAVATDDGPFCRPCFSQLKGQIEHALRQQGADINYPSAAVGAVLGGAAGVLVWWGFVVVTNISFGLVAVVIGLAVGKGILMFTGGKRSRGLQGLAAGVSALAFFYASYLVNRTFILKYIKEEEGVEASLPFVPDLGMFVGVVEANFQFFDLIFLAIVVFQAWKIPAPYKISFKDN
jgi:hypothetical protein